MKKIELTQRQYAIIDDEDIDVISSYKYHATKNRDTFYAARSVYRPLHREIAEKALGRKLKDNEEVHHINDNGLDNRKCNLQVVTRSQHKMLSKKMNKKTSSKHKGVDWRKDCKKWRARICIEGKQISLGYFDNELDAAIAYNNAAKEHCGKFIAINQI